MPAMRSIRLQGQTRRRKTGVRLPCASKKIQLYGDAVQRRRRNEHSRPPLVEKLGFVQLGTIPDSFRMKDGSYRNICPYYRTL